MLSSCMRGYDGDDVSREHVEERNRIQVCQTSNYKLDKCLKKLIFQSLECKLFGEVVGGSFVGAQVEDILGTNHVEIEQG